MCAENRFQKLRSAGAVQPRNAEYFALPCIKRNIAQAAVLARKILHAEHFTTRLVKLGRIAVCQLPANHKPDYFGNAHFLCLTRGNRFAVPHYGDFIGNPQNLLHFVRDVYYSAALLFQRIYNFKKALRLRLGKRGGGFVKHNNTRAERNCLCNFNHLPL